MSSKTATVEQIELAGQFMPLSEYKTLIAMLDGEEGDHARETFARIAETIKQTPAIYEQDGKGNGAVAHLHYFQGSADIWVTELDPDRSGQIEGFGMVDLGYGPELGYLVLNEYLAAGCELDLHFQPTTLAQIKAASGSEVTA